MTIDQCLAYKPIGTYVADAEFLEAAENFIQDEQIPINTRAQLCRLCDEAYGIDAFEGSDEEYVADYIDSLGEPSPA